MAFSLLANSSPEVDESQKMELTIGSLSSYIGSSGSTSLLDPWKSGLSASKIKTIAMSGSSVGSSSEVNSPVSFAATEDTQKKIEELNETRDEPVIEGIMDKSHDSQRDFTTGSSGISRSIHQLCVIITEATEENDHADNASASKIKTIATSGSSVGSSSKVNSPVSFAATEDTQNKIEELNGTRDKPDIEGTVDKSHNSQRDFATGSSGISRSIHQLCVIITEAAEENDHADNGEVDAQVDKPRNNGKKEKEKIHISNGEWRIIMSAINHGTEVPAVSRREVLMGYQYALHQRRKKLREEKDKFRRSQENNSVSSGAYWDEYSNALESSIERHRDPKHSRRTTAWARQENHIKSISAHPSDDEEDFVQEMPEVALVAAQAYLLTT
jgi:hypothetical protein